MNESITSIPILISFFITLLLIPFWIKRAKNAGIMGKDLHKLDKREIAESGGITVMVGFVLGILVYVAINTFIFNNSRNFIEIFSLLTVVILISCIGLVDDILGWKIGLNKRARLVLIAFASIPLMAINAGKSLISFPFLGNLDIGIIYPLILIPLGIVGASTTFNFLAGYNGLEAGQGIIILSAISLVSFFTGNFWLSIISLCMVASLLAFLFYNFFPAKIFPGDSLTYAVGGLIAIISILGDFEKISVFFFTPYIIETFLKLRGGLKKQSFGEIKEDGSLDLKYKKIYGLEHLSIKLMKHFKIKPTEKRVVFSIWIFQIIIILLVFVIFRNGIFR